MQTGRAGGGAAYEDRVRVPLLTRATPHGMKEMRVSSYLFACFG